MEKQICENVLKPVLIFFRKIPHLCQSLNFFRWILKKTRNYDKAFFHPYFSSNNDKEICRKPKDLGYFIILWSRD